uniref:NADH dehydrogenase subunit 4L n=1 Tax=Reinia eastlakeana tayalis TaxID=1885832 RepID=A0A224ACB9_9EUPU|nr:NADH dehydrogenase subunit 4L [Reinia eastlakeana tayalis]
MFILHLMYTLFLFMLARLFFVRSYYICALVVLKSKVLLSLVYILQASNMKMSNGVNFIMVLTISVCEAALGLSLLLTFIKMNGSDKIMQDSVKSY